MRDASPRHVGDVQQAVDTAQVDESAEIGDVLHHAHAHLILLQLLHQLLALAGAFGFQDHAARHDDVAAALVELDDLEFELLSQQLVDVRHASQRDLRTGEERVDPHQVYHHPALDLLHQRAFDRLVGLVGDADLLPDPHEVGLLLRQHDRPFLVLEMLEENFDFVARLQLGHVLEFFQRDRALGFESDVEHDHVVADLEDAGLHDLALVDRGERAVVQRHHALVLVARVFVLVVEFGAPVDKRSQLPLLRLALLGDRYGRAGWGGLDVGHD
jgi:hypothetical protein